MIFHCGLALFRAVPSTAQLATTMNVGDLCSPIRLGSGSIRHHAGPIDSTSHTCGLSRYLWTERSERCTLAGIWLLSSVATMQLRTQPNGRKDG